MVKVAIFDFIGKLGRLKDWRIRALWKPPIKEEGEVELSEKKMIKTLFDSTQTEICLSKK